jgi:hypothetical protein
MFTDKIFPLSYVLLNLLLGLDIGRKVRSKRKMAKRLVENR